ncbi:hypothetical protein CCDG5_0647 [[Clostridium] cellulosi]|uniref:Prepilin type IV endopeptidase peptidase domain-containing protein n=1 Tax=[Clostridium] cellulosi TaxID=29343 RepID=A0A078KMM1_9FIRM|nr:MAG: prepilin peptidase [[Clostridium] cellulosi]CDZ23777.1 hypothetical protein CCDG5_0647 [[Clostridium] cellulosi]
MEKQKGVTVTALYILAAAFIAELSAAAVIDLKTMKIPDIINIIIAGTGLVYSFLSPPFYRHIVGALAGGIPILLISMHSGMGGGDVKLAAAAGLFVGGLSPIWSLIIAFLLGGATSFILIAIKYANGKSRIPFAPFLSTGFIITLFWGGI